MTPLLRPTATTSVTFFAIALGAASDVRADWKPAPSPLKTRWADQVSPDKARPEYPRPQFVRSAWQNLNGLWEFAFDDSNQGRKLGWHTGSVKLDGTILVPWTFEAALSGIGRGKEVHERVWYRRLFNLPEAWRGQRVLLHFGAVDWEATVWINGHELGVHRGGYTPFSFDVTDALKGPGPQTIVVSVYDPSDPAKGAYQPKGKQLGSHSIWYTRTTGIWQTVWLEPVSPVHLADVRINADLSGKIRLRAKIDGRGAVKLVAIASLGAQETARREWTGEAGSVEMTLVVQQPRAWSPETPLLYDLRFLLWQDGRITDRVQAYTAFREVSLRDKRLCLNGRPYFLRGVLDQGFWPDGVYTPPTDEAIRNDVFMTRAFGLNTARKHVKIEDPRWYYYCDQLGLLVAQDMPSSHNLKSAEAKENFVNEWRAAIDALANHPCVILWIPFNEDWGKPGAFQDHVVDTTRAADPTRPIIDASGWSQRQKTDLTDIHDYGNDLAKHARASPARTTWIGEYGGIALPVAGHTWVAGWGYQVVHSPAELLAKYKFLTDQINGAPGLSGFVYTQLTDVEQELNGLMTYDRIPKAPPEKFAEINRTGKFAGK
jgi:beta-galactosidase/beta-glucuronidase